MIPSAPASPAGEDAPPQALVLPMAALEDLLAPTAGAPSTRLAHGLFVAQPLGTDACAALAGPLSAAPLNSLWPDPREPARTADGVLLLHLADAASWAQPTDDAWLLQTAPAWRLATTLLRPALLVLRLDRHHGAQAAWRSPLGAWHPVPWLELPGSRQRRVGLPAQGGVVSAESAPASSHARLGPPPSVVADDAGAGLDLDRHSRQRGGLGAVAHQRFQQGVLGLVGLGRIGSGVATTAVRLGWRVVGLDPDTVQPHNLDGDFLPLHEGLPKARALQKSLGSFARPGAAPDMRALSVSSPAAGALTAHCDLGLLTMVDNLPSLVWAAAWALATLKLHVCVATGLDGEGGLVETEIRVLLPGRGCPLCVGGLAEPLAQVRAQLARGEGEGTPDDFRRQRPGSVRSVSVAAGHLALRTMEHVVQGRLRSSLFRRLRETPGGGLDVQEQPIWRAPIGCPFCRQFQGAGTVQVTHRRLLAALDACMAWQGEGGGAMRAADRPLAWPRSDGRGGPGG